MAYTPNVTFTSGEQATITKINQVLANLQAVFPVGSLIYIHQAPTAVETTYLGKWIQLNGSAVSRTTYATLFGVVSTAYGAGDGSTTFNLPDLRGRPAFAVATTGHADVNAFGDSDGAALASRRMRHAHTFSNGSHSHGWSGTLDNGGGHQHSYNYESQSTTGCTTGGTDTNEFANSTTGPVTTGGSSTDHSHTVTPTISSGGAVSTIGTAGTTTDQPAFIVAGCWYMAYV